MECYRFEISVGIKVHTLGKNLPIDIVFVLLKRKFLRVVKDEETRDDSSNASSLCHKKHG